LLTIFSCDYTTIIKVLVGPEEQFFIVHKDVICAKSKFFEAACGPGENGQEGTVRLPKVDLKVFQHYVDWAYGETLVAGSTVDEDEEMAINLHLLRGVLDDVKLRNQTIKALTSHSAINKKAPNAADTKAIWAGTTPKSLLRKWVVDELVMRGNRDRFERDIADYPTGLVQEVTLKLLKQKSTTSSKAFQANLQEYLEAEDDA
jgi:hypothetical protein